MDKGNKKSYIGRKISAVLFYIAYLIVTLVNGLVINECIIHKITYYYGSLLFLPIIIVSYWIILIFEYIAQKNNTIPKKLLYVMIKISDLLNLAIIGFWVYAYFFIPQTEFQL